MEHTLFYITAALGISIVINIFLKRLGISQIIGYIFTGTIMVYAFDLRELSDTTVLEHIGEFGIVFLMLLHHCLPLTWVLHTLLERL